MKKIPLPVKVPEEQVRDVIADARHFNLTKDGVVQAALKHLFLFKQSERARIYSQIPEKIFGRPITKKV